MKWAKKPINRHINKSATFFLCAILLVLIVVLQIGKNQLINNFQLSNVEQIYGEKYHRISIFFCENKKKSEDDIKKIKGSLYEEFQNNGNGNLSIYDTYVGRHDLQLNYKNKYEDVIAYSISNNFFSFHNRKFIKGMAFGDDGEKDQIVINKSLAYSLFGSYDIVGQAIMINGYTVLISGVIEDRDDWMKKIVTSKEKEVYFSNALIAKLDLKDEYVQYEILVHEKMDGYSLKSMKSAWSVDTYQETDSLRELGLYFVDETTRFSTKNIVKNYFNTLNQIQKATPFSVPYWENERIVVEKIISNLFMLQLLLSIILIKNIYCLHKSYKLQ